MDRIDKADGLCIRVIHRHKMTVADDKVIIVFRVKAEQKAFLCAVVEGKRNGVTVDGIGASRSGRCLYWCPRRIAALRFMP